MSFGNWTKAKKIHHGVLLIGMILSVAAFGAGMELISAGVIILAIGTMALIKRQSDRPVYDERDISLAEESTHQAVMLSGAFLGVVMIVISIGMGLGRWSYPEWIAPYYLSWGAIIGLTIVIEVLKRYKVIE
ncbi:DUF2178 domain-containing protein [Candidatus Nanohalobium constans]|uniref:DUF2178 domain-containing protein n=1 Tax=Candidatus Nanohalobium constans TaxID=2565781 RepID=A0A5Q0UG97_9ARCH|nr:DUF2178 domain-containing protein [Candidatus Nanohalobium constans]QGA80594.1 hypothetical protein LC1Nh_0705 [Candidatus Nanohalobium constans]